MILKITCKYHLFETRGPTLAEISYALLEITLEIRNQALATPKMSHYKVFPTQLIDFWNLEIRKNQVDFEISYMILAVSHPSL